LYCVQDETEAKRLDKNDKKVKMSKVRATLVACRMMSPITQSLTLLGMGLCAVHYPSSQQDELKNLVFHHFEERDFWPLKELNYHCRQPEVRVMDFVVLVSECWCLTC